MRYEELTGKILETCFEVSKELGTGFIESVYEKALVVALTQRGLRVERQFPLKVYFRAVLVGEFYADMVVEEKVIVEIKAIDSLISKHFSQVLNYLKATGMEVGMIVNFGNAKLEYRRFDNRMFKGPILKNLFQE